VILMIDNFDSFTYNLVQYLGELGAEVKVCRNNAVSLEDIARLRPAQIVHLAGARYAGAGRDFAADDPALRRLDSRSSASASATRPFGQAFGGKVVKSQGA
jgi:anthranilate synthase component 2